MQNCPCCRARLNAEPQCPRCKADFTLVHRSEAYSEYWRNQALQFYLQDQRENCLNALDQSLLLQQSSAAVKFKQFVLQQQRPLNEEIKHLCVDTWLNARPVLQRISEHLENRAHDLLAEHPPAETGRLMYQKTVELFKQAGKTRFDKN